MRCFVVAGFLVTSASRGPSAVTELLVNFGCPIHISGMAEARALKLCTKGYHIKSSQRDDIRPVKGAWFCSRDPFLSAQLWTYSARHSTSCYQQMRARRTLVITPTALEATLAKAKLHRFVLSPCLLQTCLYNI